MSTVAASRSSNAFLQLRDAGRDFLADNAFSLSAALSYYTLLSFAPLMILAVWLSASLGQGLQNSLVEQIGLLVGQQAQDVARSVIENAEDRPSIGSAAGIIGILVSLVAATTVFAQLQQSLNRIWNIRARPGNAIWSWLRRRILSVGVIAAIGFVALVSMIVSAMLGAFLPRSGPFWDMFNQVTTGAVFVGLFTLMFRYLPDARLAWRDALTGGVLTALLFTLGKFLIGIYLSRGTVGGAYGAASSVVLLVVWVYYASAIFFFGAEFVQARLNASGRRIPVADTAEPVAS